MPKLIAIVVAVVAVFTTAGCSKKHYSANCSRGVALVPPWDAMKLPVNDNTRVCSANDLKVDLEHLDGDRAGWEHAYEAMMTAQGFTKDRCSSTSCNYSKAGEKVSVQINQVANGKKAKTIVHLSRTPGPAAPAVPAAAGSGSAK